MIVHGFQAECESAPELVRTQLAPWLHGVLRRAVHAWVEAGPRIPSDSAERVARVRAIASS